MALYMVISMWLQLLFNQDNDRLTVASPEISGVTATAQFSWREQISGAMFIYAKGITASGLLSKIIAGTRFTLAVESLWSNSLSRTNMGTSLGSGTGSWDSYDNDI